MGRKAEKEENMPPISHLTAGTVITGMYVKANVSVINAGICCLSPRRR